MTPAFIDPSFFQIPAPKQKALYTRAVSAQPAIESGYEAFLASGGVVDTMAPPSVGAGPPTVTQPSESLGDPYDSYYPAPSQGAGLPFQPDMGGGGQMALATYNIPAEMAGYVLWRGENKRALNLNMNSLVAAAQASGISPRGLGQILSESMMRIPNKNAWRLNVRKMSRIVRGRF